MKKKVNSKSVGKKAEQSLKAVSDQPSPPVVIINRYRPIYHGKED